MPRSVGEILKDIEAFEPVDGNWLQLDDLLAELWRLGVPADALPSLFGVFERYSDEDGSGVLWSIVHGVESLEIDYEQPLRDSLARQPSLMGLILLDRLGRSNPIDEERFGRVEPRGSGPVKRLHQGLLIGSTVLASWLAMQAVHECGHVLGAWLTGGKVSKVVLHPLTISRTDLAWNPNPLLVVWAGPVFGASFPLALWGVAAALKMPGAFVLRFFAGFCLIANGAYLALGSFGRVGDCGEMLQHGSPIWQLWLFGAIAIPSGLALWHRQGAAFGLGQAQGEVDRRVAYATLAASLLLLVLGLSVGGE